jgi:micrococcal nuclease
MAGTRVEARLIKVVDGDTIKVELDGRSESVRLACLDTEESWPGGNKPVTEAGRRASAWAKTWFGADVAGQPTTEVGLDLEFDTADPPSLALVRHRDNYGRLLAYAWLGTEHYNLAAVRAGWSPYFVKYGRSRRYHGVFLQAEARAQASGAGIWDPGINGAGPTRDYRRLLPWWQMRDSWIEDYRATGPQAGVLSVRLDHADLIAAARREERISVFCDLQGGINRWVGDAALIYAGSPAQPFNLWIPDRRVPAVQDLLRLLETRYTGEGRQNYVYVTGPASLYPAQDDGKPQIVLTDAAQLADLPPA